MGQSLRLLLNIFFIILLASCDQPSPQSSVQATTKIVSLTPAGSDMIIAMGLSDQLVGVSAYDKDDRVKNLPKVGDYMRIDWEQIAMLKPTHLFLQGKKDRLPPGIEEHCKELNISANILQIDRLDDIYAAIDQIGKATSQPGRADRAKADLQEKLPRNHDKPVPAIIMIGGEGKLIVGRDNYLNDLLELAGGVNVIETNGYISIDAEKAATLSPEVIFILSSSNAPSETKSPVIASDKWPAIRDKRIYTMADDQSLLPGTCVSKVYDYFNDHLHPTPGATTRP